MGGEWHLNNPPLFLGSGSFSEFFGWVTIATWSGDSFHLSWTEGYSSFRWVAVLCWVQDLHLTFQWFVISIIFLEPSLSEER